jgi:acetylornithine deacetylase/succinyl-diaminopimelate desuccinylase-like protein
MEKELLKQLVEIPSYLDKKKGFSEQKIATFIENFFRKNFKNYEIIKFTVENGRNNLLIISRNPKIIFCCHLDTVLPSGKDHVKLIIKKDKACGLGTKDMKGGTVSALLAALESPRDLQNKVGFIFYCDEERIQKGMEIMLKNRNKIPKSVRYFISPESSFKLGYGCRGYAIVKVTIHGKRAHSSRPQLGTNAGEILFNVYEKLKINFKSIKTRLGESSIVLASMNLGVLEDNKLQIQNNSVPDYSVAFFSIRLSKDTSKQELKILFENEIKKIHSLYFSVNVQQLRSPSTITKDKDLKLFLESAKQVGFEIELSDPGFSGYNDVAMISSKTRIPFLGFGPYGEGNHGPDEWVSLKSIEDTKNIFKNFIENI